MDGGYQSKQKTYSCAALGSCCICWRICCIIGSPRMRCYKWLKISYCSCLSKRKEDVECSTDEIITIAYLDFWVFLGLFQDLLLRLSLWPFRTSHCLVTLCHELLDFAFMFAIRIMLHSQPKRFERGIVFLAGDLNWSFAGITTN